MTFLLGSHPILDCAASAAWECEVLGGDETREWTAMRAAGRAIASHLLEDLAVAGCGCRGRLLLLIGKGHNGGDAMLAAAELLSVAGADWRVEVGFVFRQNRLRPLALRAWQHLQAVAAGSRVHAIRLSEVADQYTAVLDGVFGFQFRPPLPPAATAWLAAANAADAAVRAAVDLPSGMDGSGAFIADVTYATGILKTPLLTLPNAGRVRYLDLGFFKPDSMGELRVLTRSLLKPLRRLRPARSDKRHFGHVVLVGGSRSYPGAIAMATAAALSSGAGLVTACVPESLAPSMAARWPEAMWMGCPETPDGGIAIEAGLAIRDKLRRAQALVIGPGLARERETQALAAELIRGATIPLVLDADALQPELVGLGDAPRILTPHAGEWDRIKNSGTPKFGLVVRKGSITQIEHNGVTYCGIDGGPVLARGGSGDILAGLLAGLLAGQPDQPLLCAAQAVVWQGLAARSLARAEGEVAVLTTSLLNHLNRALREGVGE